jgi:hypothetical protein
MPPSTVMAELVPASFASIVEADFAHSRLALDKTPTRIAL